MARRRRRGRGALAVVVVLGLGVATVSGVVAVLRDTHPAPVTEQCQAELDGTPWTLATDQADNAALVVATTLRRSLPARAATVAIATALQESGLRNLDHGDRDSLGLFQQRPSQGWGTTEQVSDPYYATGSFLDRLVQVPGWQAMEVTAAAQAVQRSAFPDAYAYHEGGARAWASGLTGWSPAAVTCTLATPSAAGSADALTARAVKDLGDLPADTSRPDVVVLDARGLGATDQADRLAWAVGQWAVAVADRQQLASVQVGDQVWHRTATWATADDTVPTGHVRITLATA